MRFLCLLACLAVAALPASAEDKTALVGGHKELELDRAVHDWGLAGQNEEYESTFTYTNRGSEAVTDIRAIGDCGCNRITLSKTELAPGEAGEMTVVFQTVMLAGHLEKLIRLISKKRASGEAKLRQKIAIVKGLVVAPAALRFGTVPTDTLPKRTFRVQWYEGHGKPFQVTAARVPGHDILTTQVRAYTDPKERNWKGWEIEVAFRTLPALGMFSAEVAVDTDHPKHPRITVALSANITGKVWMQSHSLTFGSFYASEERKATLRFRPRDRAKTRFGTVTARALAGRVTDVTVKVDPVHGDDGYWILSARVPADAPPGALDGEIIVLDPDIPGEAPIEVKVKGTVRDPKRRRK